MDSRWFRRTLLGGGLVLLMVGMAGGWATASDGLPSDSLDGIEGENSCGPLHQTGNQIALPSPEACGGFDGTFDNWDCDGEPLDCFKNPG